MREPPGRAPTAWDVAVSATVAAAVITNAALSLSTPRPTVTATVFGLVSAVALLARTRLPVMTLMVVAACGVLPTLAIGAFPDFYAAFVPALAAIYAVAARCSTRTSAVVPVVAACVLACYTARVPSFRTASQAVFTITGMVLAFAAGRTSRLLRHRADAEASRADLMLRESDLQAREAVVAERERIARELHDVIAHDVAVMVVQAGAAERLLAADSGQVMASLTQIQTSGRKAIDELHLLLGALRDDSQALLTQPGLRSLQPLVDELCRLGLPITLTVSGRVRDVGDALDLSAYRLVQEALTNVLKHAAGSRTQVSVRYDSTELTLCVADDGNGAAADATRLPASGHGLVGMRERVRLFGGTLTTGVRPQGGWAVTAQLPIPRSAR